MATMNRLKRSGEVVSNHASKMARLTSQSSDMTSQSYDKTPESSDSGSVMTSQPSGITSQSPIFIDTGQTSPSVDEISQDQQNRQNELPRNVNYQTKGKMGLVTVLRQNEPAKLILPQSCSYHAARREVYVADWGSHRVTAHDRDGTNHREFYTNLKPATRPRDVAVSTDGQFVYIVTENAVIKTNINGERVKIIKDITIGKFQSYYSAVCYRQFTLIIDANNGYVIILDEEDQVVRRFGKDHLKLPLHVAVSEEGDVYVTDEETSCICVFSWEGEYLRTFGATGGDEHNIAGITVDADGVVCVARPEDDRLDVYDPRGEVITSIGSEGEGPGQLKGPMGLSLCPDGSLIVADFCNQRVQILGES